MSLLNNNTRKQKSKQLNETEIGKIEAYLNENKSAKEIADELGRDPSGIRKEIKNYSVIKESVTKRCTGCSNYIGCRRKGLCGSGMKGCASKCSKCSTAIEVCPDYSTEPTCKLLKGHRKVCNGCEFRNVCKQTKRLYIADKAARAHAENRRNSVKEPKALGNEKYLTAISEGIKKGKSPDVMLGMLKNKFEISISLPTLYDYIDRGYMAVTNIDLRNKVKRKPSKKKGERKDSRTKHRENGRSYHDLSEVARTKEEFGRAEMDTVEGIKGGKLLLTLLIKKPSFLFGIPIKNKTQKAVKRELDKLERKLEGTYQEVFKTIVTDNGVEFLDYKKIENSILNKKEKRTSVHYADSYASYQKGQIENQHRLIRYFFPKGKDFSKYSNKEILDKINRINNYPRKNLGYSTPYKEMEKIIGKEKLNALGFYEIDFDELDMTNSKAA